MNARRTCLALVVLHAFALVAHGQAHQALPVPLGAAQNAFVVVVIVIAPILAAFLIWRGAPRFGASLLGAAMLGAWIFGVVNHYVIESADHVARVPATGWGELFRASAHALAAIELAGVAAALWLLQSPPERA